MSFASPIDIEGLSVRYVGRDQPALRELTDRVAPGEAVVITGPSGSGKTTICRVLTGFIPELIPASVSGDVRIGGKSVWSIEPEVLAASLGMVQQDPDSQICTLNVWQEVAFGPENLGLDVEEIRRRVDGALRSVDIHHLAGRQTTTLSGGEKQRVAVAAILAMQPSTLLLDEPTANLDPDGAQDLFRLIAELSENRGTSLVVVEHRVRPLLGLHPRLVVLDRGRVAERHAGKQRIDLGRLGLRDRWPARPVTEAAEGKPLLGLEGVTFDYGVPLLRDLSLWLRAGEVLGVIGPNGGGKTTLLRLIAGLETPREGAIRIASSKRVGFVFQHPHHQIFERTVEQELRLDRPLSDEQLSMRLAEARLVGLEAAAPLSLSLGEQRRLTLMTAIANEPDLLLLDEPFIGQDRRNVLWILSQIERVRLRGGTSIVVSHDTGLLSSIADWLLFVDREATFFGRPEHIFEVLRKEGRVAYLPETEEEP